MISVARCLVGTCLLLSIWIAVGDAQLLQAISCPTKIASAMAGRCKTRLDERLDLVDKAESDINNVAPSMFRCCYFAEYVHCIADDAREECGTSVVKSVEQRVNQIYQQINNKCEDYSANSPSCIFVIWFNFILTAALVFIVILFGCCLGACLCR